MTPEPSAEAGPSVGAGGVLVIDKPYGMSSARVCRIVASRLERGPARTKVGHAGTLDPLATGVVLVLVGGATRQCETLMGLPKTYEAEIDLSRRSTTDDHEGDLTPVLAAAPPSRPRVDEACRGFVGTVLQRPPSHSAVKVGGRRAYRLARAGRTVDLDPRPVRIDEVTVLWYSPPIVAVRVVCGRGTYIRSLARDLGGALTGGGMLHGLRRTAVGPFDQRVAITPAELPRTIGPELLRPIEA